MLTGALVRQEAMALCAGHDRTLPALVAEAERSPAVKRDPLVRPHDTGMCSW